MTETELEVPERTAQPQAAGQAPARMETDTRSQRVFVIRPAPRWPHLDFGELWHFRELLATFVWRDIKVRYKQTLLGVFWAILVPVFTAAIYVIVFGKFAKFPAGKTPYALVVLGGLLPLQYFTSSLTNSSISLVANAGLVTKVYFPRVLLPLAAVLVPLVDLVIAMGILVGLMAWYGTWPVGAEVLLAPAFLGLALLAALGAGFLLSAVNVRYRDVPYAIPVFLQVLPLVSAVPYAFNEIPEKWQWLLSINPMTAVVTGWRWTILGAAPPDPAKLAVSVAVTGILVLVGLTYFRSSEPKFADTI
ncbi:MAG: ABC transporter permease [Gaiellaceae bacterium]